MTTPIITLSNDFHNTESRVRPVEITEGRYKGWHKISKRTARRLHNELCGSDDCCCGDSFGARGGAYVYVVARDWNNDYIVDMERSHVE